jgi:ABC-type dipeptide/oligopeptide/nickel transport system permease component
LTDISIQDMRLIARRVAAALVLILTVASTALLLAQLAPGDYASQIGASAVQADNLRHQLGLDRPLADRYVTWLAHSLTFDLGESFQYHVPVIALVRERAVNTGILAAAALALATAFGIPCGVLTGSRRGGLIVGLIRGASLVLLSVPPLISSLLLLAIAARTGWLPVSGMGGIRHLVVPSLALALPIAAVLERLQAQALREALARPSTRAARARGIPASRIVWRYAWRQSLGPILAMYGVIVGSLLSGSFAVEIVTSWPGLGQLMLGALMARDTNVVAGCAAAGAVFLALAILAADLAHAFVDPRIEMERAS